MIKIVCTSCQKPLSLDETKLPMKEVTFPCPACKAKLSVDRRKSFFILVSENLRTLDGNAAFLYGVNLIVAQKDLGAFQQIYRDALGYHERLYSAMNSVAKAMNA